jgi:hypothetical protein
VINDGKEKVMGNWTYNSSSCTLEIKVDRDNEVMHLLIRDITPEHIYGIMYMQKDYEHTYEVLLTSSPQKK